VPPAGGLNVQINSNDSVVANSRFIGNDTGAGGAVLLGGSGIRFDSCQFIDNSSTSSGGAIFDGSPGSIYMNYLFAG